MQKGVQRYSFMYHAGQSVPGAAQDTAIMPCNFTEQYIQQFTESATHSIPWYISIFVYMPNSRNTAWHIKTIHDSFESTGKLSLQNLKI